VLTDRLAISSELLQRMDGERMTLIPPTELSPLFRHPDYSVNGRTTWIIAGNRAIAEALMAA